MPGQRYPTSRDSNKAKQARLAHYLKDSRYSDLSNRAVAKLAQVDEGTIRRYRKGRLPKSLQDLMGKAKAALSKAATRTASRSPQ